MKLKRLLYGLERVDGKQDNVDSGSSEGAVGLKGSRAIVEAARLEAAMASNPAAFSEMMRDRAARHFADADSSGSTGPRFLGDCCRRIPLEKQNLLGYHLWTISRVLRSLWEGYAEGAELICFLAAAMTEQALLDGHWHAGPEQRCGGGPAASHAGTKWDSFLSMDGSWV